MLHGDPVLVVLDEPNANLDLEGERALSRSLLVLRAQGVSLVGVSPRNRLLAGVVGQREGASGGVPWVRVTTALACRRPGYLLAASSNAMPLPAPA